LRSAVGHLWLIPDMSRCGYQHAESDDARYSVERSQMFSRDCQNVKRRELGRLAPCIHIELGADPTNEFRLTASRREHARQKKQVTCLHRFHIDAERLRWRRQLDAKLFQPLFGATTLL